MSKELFDSLASTWVPHHATRTYTNICTPTTLVCTQTAFGDASLKGKGLCADPDVSQHHIVAGDEFVVVASDGLYDVLTSQQVVDFVTAQKTSNPSTKLNTIAKKLTTRAIKNGSLDNTTVSGSLVFIAMDLAAHTSLTLAHDRTHTSTDILHVNIAPLHHACSGHHRHAGFDRAGAQLP